MKAPSTTGATRAPPPGRAGATAGARRHRPQARRGDFARLLGRVGDAEGRPGARTTKATGSTPPAPGRGEAAKPMGARLTKTGDGPAPGPRLEERGRARDARDALSPFAPPPSVLVPPATPASSAAVAGSAASHAYTAAMVERLVTSLRLGRLGRHGHEVQMALSLRGTGSIDVRLRLVDGRLSAILSAPARHRAEAERIAASFEAEIASRGLQVDEVQVETA